MFALIYLNTFIFALQSSCRNRGSVGGYFLAGRSMHWIPVKQYLQGFLKNTCPVFMICIQLTFELCTCVDAAYTLQHAWRLLLWRASEFPISKFFLTYCTASNLINQCKGTIIQSCYIPYSNIRVMKDTLYNHWHCGDGISPPINPTLPWSQNHYIHDLALVI